MVAPVERSPRRTYSCGRPRSYRASSPVCPPRARAPAAHLAPRVDSCVRRPPPPRPGARRTKLLNPRPVSLPERLRTARRALGYDRAFGGRWLLDDDSPLNLLYGSGEVYSTVADLARYDLALFGNQLIRPASLAQMFKPGELADGTSVPYGFGWSLTADASGEPYYGHPGNWLGFSAYILHFPKDDLAVLRVPKLAARPLPLVEPIPGAPVAIVGYPENGPLDSTPARIGRTGEVLTDDAYGHG